MNDSMTVALVTGASRGIGQAIALNLGNRGFTVVGTATSESGAASISAYSIKGEGMCLDVSSDESVAALMETISEK